MRFELLILGANSAVPFRERFPSSQVLYISDHSYLIDCGEGAQIQMSRFGVRYSRINQIFISHLHGDHFYGLCGLITSMSLNGRQKPLQIFGPKDLKDIIVTQLYKAYEKLSFQIVFFDTNPSEVEMIFEDALVKVYSIPLDHRIETTGFKFVEQTPLFNIKKDMIQLYELSIDQIKTLKSGADIKLSSGQMLKVSEACFPREEPRSYAYYSDTKFLESLSEHIKNVDLLYHESTYLSDLEVQAIERGHSTAAQAARMAKMSNAQKLILGHYSNRYHHLDGFLEEAKTIFPNVELAKEGYLHCLTKLPEKISAE